MRCTSPLYRVPVGSLNSLLLTSQDRKRIYNGGVMLNWEQLQSYNDMPGWHPELVQICPCGQCIACRLNKSRDWAIRCSLEASLHEYNYFVTLTYDNMHLPSGYDYIDYNGDIWDSTLRPSDPCSFIKCFREWERSEYGHTGTKVFYCGEYGGDTGRPHYHLCLFNCVEIPDFTFGFKKGRFSYYKSNILERCWADGKSSIPRGFVDVSDLSFDAAAYTARYCLKKQTGRMNKDFMSYYANLDHDNPDLPRIRVQPFVRMSNRPGIAYEYFQQNKGLILEEDAVKYQRKHELYQSKPPQYFDHLFDREDPDGFAELKARRSAIGRASSSVRSRLFSEDERSRQAREEQQLIDKERRYYVRHM